eukprot:549159-Hanusia_phi.AAC.1
MCRRDSSCMLAASARGLREAGGTMRWARRSRWAASLASTREEVDAAEEVEEGVRDSEEKDGIVRRQQTRRSGRKGRVDGQSGRKAGVR